MANEEAAIARLAEVWASEDAESVAQLQRGLAEEHIRTQLAEAGCPASPFAIAWWTWQNGAPAAGSAFKPLGPPAIRPVSLAYALEDRQDMLRRTAELDDIDPSDWWRESWIPVAHSGRDRVVLDGASGRSLLVLHALFDFPFIASDFVEAADAVEGWARLVDRRLWRFDEVARRWQEAEGAAESGVFLSAG